MLILTVIVLIAKLRGVGIGIGWTVLMVRTMPLAFEQGPESLNGVRVHGGILTVDKLLIVIDHSILGKVPAHGPIGSQSVAHQHGLDVPLGRRVAPHVAVQGRLQVGHVVEGAAVHDLALQGAKPGLDPVQPGGLGGDEVEVEAGMGLLPSLHLAVLVGRVVVQDQVHLPGGETPGQSAQEGQALLMPVAGGTGIVDAAGVQVQGGPQGVGCRGGRNRGAGGAALTPEQMRIPPKPCCVPR